MDTQTTDTYQVKKPHKKRKSKAEIIKQTYLPYLFLSLAVVIILIFIIGALTRSSQGETIQLLPAIGGYLL